jgi:hypothetical protein
MKRAHLRPYQPFNVTPKTWCARRPPVNPYSRIAAPARESAATKISAVVDMQHLWQTCDRPVVIDLTLA